MERPKNQYGKTCDGNEKPTATPACVASSLQTCTFSILTNNSICASYQLLLSTFYLDLPAWCAMNLYLIQRNHIQILQPTQCQLVIQESDDETSFIMKLPIAVYWRHVRHIAECAYTVYHTPVCTLPSRSNRPTINIG